jgi:L-fuconolactonase
MRIDSHQHFWKYSPADYPWIPDGSVIQRDHLPDDLLPQLQAAHLEGCIAVQARQSLEENLFLTGLAQQHRFILGVVGWIDLRSPEVETQAMAFKNMPKAVGVRHVVQDETDPDFMAGEAFRRGITVLKSHQLVYDVLIYQHQLPDAIRLVRDFPEQRFVLDHVAKPRISDGQIRDWSVHMSELSGYSNVFVKLSGMVTEADHRTWSIQQLKPYWEVALQTFGPSRLMFGSDWPVVRLAAEYSRWIDVVSGWLEPLSSPDRERIWGGTAQRAYLTPFHQRD